MKNFFSMFSFIIFILLISSCSRKIDESKLQERKGICYKVGDEEPYTGKVVRILKKDEHEIKTREKSYKDGKLDGITIYWYDDGQKEKEETFKDGKLDGLTEEWHVNGQKSFEGNYKNGELDGKVIEWYDDGQKKKEETYKDGKLDGLKEEWHVNGQKSFEGNYKNDKLDGKVTEWYDNGQKMSEENYKEGKRVGISKRWHRNGQLSYEGKYKNNHLDGLITEWYDNGQKMSEKNYIEGKRFGKFIYWDSDGFKSEEKNYNEKGKLNGNYLDFSIYGTSEKGQYKNGKRNKVFLVAKFNKIQTNRAILTINARYRYVWYIYNYFYSDGRLYYKKLIEKFKDEDSVKSFFKSINLSSNNAPGNDKVYEFFAVTVKPVIIHKEKAMYPISARNAGIEGMVVVQVTIGKTGLVENAKIFKSKPPLDEAALIAAKKCLFKPAINNGNFVKVKMNIPFNFKK